MPPPTDLAIPSSVGPLIVGELVLFAFFGLLSAQTYFYSLGSRDKDLIRILVYGVYAIMLTQIVMAGHQFFVRFATPNTTKLNSADLGWFYVPVLGGTVGAIVQLFYAWRISVLSHNRIGPCLLAVLSITSACSAYISGIFGSKVSTISALNSDSPGLRIASTIWYTSSAICDVVIAVYMVYLLTRERSSVSSTRRAIRRIVRLTVETNALTASVAVTTLVLLLALPGKIYFTTLALLLPSIYANTLLVMLNVRYRVAPPEIPDCRLSICRTSLSNDPLQIQPTVLGSFKGEYLHSDTRSKRGSDVFVQ